MKRTTALLFMVACLGGCASLWRPQPETLVIPYMPETVCVDGVLNEPCYRWQCPFEAFVAAGDAARPVPPTRAWLFWNEEALICAFECEDPTPAWAPPSGDEGDVNPQDRAEIFLWPGESSAVYYCIEAAPLNAVHDYKAGFYRKFDDAWSPEGGWLFHAQVTPTGYTVEMAIPRAAIEAMRMELRPKQQFRLGLFRADYDAFDGTPTWITWIDHGGAPDFHRAKSFGAAVLGR